MLIQAALKVGRKTVRATGADKARALVALIAKLDALKLSYAIAGVTFEEV